MKATRSPGLTEKIIGGQMCRLYDNRNSVATGDFIEYLDECCRRTRRVVDVHIGRKRKYVTVQELFRTNCKRVPLGNVVSVWRACEDEVVDQNGAEENRDPLRVATT